MAPRRRATRSLILSDDEFYAWWDARARAASPVPCMVCGALGAHARAWCDAHTVCAACRAHGAAHGVHSCPMCPPPPARIEFGCGCGAVTRRVVPPDTVSWPCAGCGVPQHRTDALRCLTRNGAYVNCVTEDERAALMARGLHDVLRCPACGIGMERASACNEMHHCGRQSVCAGCGLFNFPWEPGLATHRAESHCPFHVDHDADAVHAGEAEARAARWRAAVAGAPTAAPAQDDEARRARLAA